MKALYARFRCESGQALILGAFFLVLLFGLGTLVIEGGSWYRADRAAQTAADAAALAGAQDLPLRWKAEASATTYWSENADPSPAITKDALTFPFPLEPTTLITVHVTRQAGVFLAQAFGIPHVTVKADAQAQVTALDELKNVAPIAIYKDYACIVANPSCFDQTVVLGFNEDDPFDPTKSKFGLLDLDRDGSAGAGDMKQWLEDGYQDYLPIDTTYPPANGEKNGIKQQLQDAADEQRILLFPVYDSATTSGYHVIGWAAFVIDDIGKWAGKEHVLTGHFVTFIAHDLAAGKPITDPSKDFGVHVITLTQ
jgi:Flp pilus assembly protein TadG